MVGHTHEDIDAVFGRVWRSIRNQHVLTPQQYEKSLKVCLKRKRDEEFFEVNDIIVIPDYSDYFNGSWNLFGNYCKLSETQHQFIYEAVTPSVIFPLGCKTTYRAYASDEVIELIKDGSTPTGLSAINTVVKVYPSVADTTAETEGMFALRKYPTKTFKPVPFPKGSAATFEEVMKAVYETVGV